MSKLIVVVGGQYGSEAKGAAAGYLARHYRAPLVIRTGGPNAGHTALDSAGIAHKLRMLPTAAVTNSRATLALAAGAVVSPEIVSQECDATGREVFIDPYATILTRQHTEAEHGDPDMQWGSTRSGVGAARADRIHRTAEIWGSWTTDRQFSARVDLMARRELRHAEGVVILETTQGYGLGLHTKEYPKTTSANCRAIDAMADVGINPWEYQDLDLQIWVVVRPYPIRVAGNSGPLYQETTWGALGLPEERTTVTNKVRRVGHWDDNLVIEALSANGASSGKVWVWFSMADQVIPSLAGKTDWNQLTSDEQHQLKKWITRIEYCGGRVAMVGTGPGTVLPWGTD